MVAPVLFGADQISLSTSDESTITPVAVNGLKIDNAASTLAGQVDFCSEVFEHIVTKFLLFQSSDGWGGLLGSVVTFAAAGTHSIATWSTCFGCIVFVFGVVHFLPIPFFSGFHMLYRAVGLFFDDNRTKEIRSILATIGLIYFIALYVRIAIADIYWLKSVFTDPIAG